MMSVMRFESCLAECYCVPFLENNRSLFIYRTCSARAAIATARQTKLIIFGVLTEA